MACIRKSRFTTFGGLRAAAATNAEGVLIIRLYYNVINGVTYLLYS